MKYNPFKYFCYRTLWYASKPLTWVIDIGVVLFFFIMLFVESNNGMYSALFTTIGYFWWTIVSWFLRFICSLFVCWAAKRHQGFHNEYCEMCGVRADN